MVDFNPENAPRGKSERTESGRTEIQDARMIKRAIVGNWPNARSRWPTHAALIDLENDIKARSSDPNLIEKVTIAVHRLLGNSDVRVVAEGVKAVVAMERQNQADELAQNKKEPVEGSVTNQQINIYLPSNGRESTGLMNGTNGNGKH